MSVSVASSAGSIFSAGNCGSHSGARKVRITSQRFASSRPIPTRVAEELVRRLLEDLLGRVEKRATLVCEVVEPEPEPTVELRVVRGFEPLHAVADDLDAFGVQWVQMLFGQLDANPVETLALVAVGLVRHLRPEHPERDRLALDHRFERGLLFGDFLGGLARELPEVALDGEAPELGDVPVSFRRPAERERLVELGQVGIALVDRAELELLLVARVVEVELLVEVGDEAVCALAEAVEVGGAERGSCAGQGALG